MFVCGDFNCHLEKQNSDSDELKLLRSATDLFILNSGTLYLEGQSESWLDVIIVHGIAKVKSVTKSEVPFIDHHDSFVVEYDFTSSKPLVPEWKFRNFSIVMSSYIDPMLPNLSGILKLQLKILTWRYLGLIPL